MRCLQSYLDALEHRKRLLLPGIETQFLGRPVRSLVIIGLLQNVNYTSFSGEVLGRLRQTDIQLSVTYHCSQT